jgi:hypothetical protein
MRKRRKQKENFHFLFFLAKKMEHWPTEHPDYIFGWLTLVVGLGVEVAKEIQNKAVREAAGASAGVSAFATATAAGAGIGRDSEPRVSMEKSFRRRHIWWHPDNLDVLVQTGKVPVEATQAIVLADLTGQWRPPLGIVRKWTRVQIELWCTACLGMSGSLASRVADVVNTGTGFFEDDIIDRVRCALTRECIPVAGTCALEGLDRFCDCVSKKKFETTFYPRMDYLVNQVLVG